MFCNSFNNTGGLIFTTNVTVLRKCVTLERIKKTKVFLKHNSIQILRKWLDSRNDHQQAFCERKISY